jgi:FkbM family methyltransferase
MVRLTGLGVEPLARHLQRVGEVRSELPNGRALKLWSRGDDWVANEVYWRGALGYEPETSSLFFSLAADAHAVFDVGAHVGYYSLLAGLASASARVYAFEPHPNVYERLRRNVALNHLENVEALRLAVGEVSGAADFFHSDTEVPSSSSLSRAFMSSWLDVGELRRTSVAVTALDDFVRLHDVRRVDLVKLDTESTEPAVLRGMTATLERDRPQIVCEVLKGWSVESQLEALLGPLGYAYYLLTPAGPSLRPSIVADETYLNHLFTTRQPTTTV